MKAPVDTSHTRQDALPPEIEFDAPGKAAEQASVLSKHRTSDGLVRYRRWPNGLISVELLEAVRPGTTGDWPVPGDSPDNPPDEHEAPPDAMEPIPAPTWQIRAIVGVRRRRG